MSYIVDLADRVRDGGALEQKERELVARLLMAIGQQFYEKTRCMFICGHGGEIELDGLPPVLLVCAEYGADFRCTASYKKVKT